MTALAFHTEYLMSRLTCKKGLVLLPLKRKFRDSQIVIITNFVVVSSVGLKRLSVLLKRLLNTFSPLIVATVMHNMGLVK